MKANKQTMMLLISAAMVLTAVCPAFGQAGVYLDHVDGIDAYGCVQEGGMVTFHMHVVGHGDVTDPLISSGFEICSDEMTWTDVTVEFTSEYPINEWFDFVQAANVWDGPQCDTVGIGLLSLFGPGLPADFDDVLFSITIGPVSGGSNMGASLALDSCWYPPSNPWCWSYTCEVAWGGPYSWTCWDWPVWTWCSPQPTILKEIDRILYFFIEYEDVNEAVLESIRIQGNIPSYEPAYIEDQQTIVASVFIMRFLGASGFRPITGDFETTYTIEYDKIDGSHIVLIGDYSLKVYPGDVTLDGEGNINDLIFAADYFWRGGGVPSMTDKEGNPWEIAELLDANGDGNIDPKDVIALKEILKL